MRRYFFPFLACLALSFAACSDDTPKESEAEEKARKLTDELMDELEASEDSTLNRETDTLSVD